ncbi:MAG: cell wall metabolism sensor histidine kinase WalK [Actinobacteria bacterium]|nr:cell wall metabolism sensor histidine kinase WalK [Actinomycetota bacterium]
MFRSVKNWLTVLIVIVVAFAMLVAWVYVVPPLRGRLVEQKLADARANAQVISDTLTEWMGYEPETLQLKITDDEALERTLSGLSTRLGGRTLVYTRNLVLLKDSGNQASPDVAEFPMLAEAVESGRPAQGTVTTQGGQVAATAVPLVPKEGPETVLAVVLVTSSLDDVDNAVNAVQRQLLFATLLALATSLLLGYMASYFIARRIRRIERSAELIAGGDLSARVPGTVEDEIGQLAETFNVMADRLRSAFAQVEYQRDRVEVLLNDLSEGVVGVSADGRVTIANPAAAILLDSPRLIGETVDDALPADVAQLWRASQEDADFDMVVFAHDDVTLEATTYPVAGDADFTSIVVLRDVTAQVRLERARRDLIANASHEFKTPLFSLAGSLELIDEGDLSAEEQREFLQIMRQQVDRLRTMAVSMLDLSRVEAGSFELNPEDVDLAAVGRSVLDEFQAQAQSKQVALTFEGDDGHTAWCDEQRLVQVLRALIDNAIKYSPPGSSVRLSSAVEDQEAVLVVADDGPGISRSELPHVFERFHRGREERSTTTGAGLGLSIAHELTEMMGGTISAESPADGGARFTVRLPRAAGVRRRARAAS